MPRNRFAYLDPAVRASQTLVGDRNPDDLTTIPHSLCLPRDDHARRTFTRIDRRHTWLVPLGGAICFLALAGLYYAIDQHLNISLLDNHNIRWLIMGGISVFSVSMPNHIGQKLKDKALRRALENLQPIHPTRDNPPALVTVEEAATAYDIKRGGTDSAMLYLHPDHQMITLEGFHHRISIRSQDVTKLALVRSIGSLGSAVIEIAFQIDRAVVSLALTRTNPSPRKLIDQLAQTLQISPPMV